MKKEIYIPGVPIAKKRPRFARRGKFVMTYNDQETEEGRVLWEIKRQWVDNPITSAIRLKLLFYMPIPKSFPKRQVPELTPHVKRPDLDNMIKFFKDVCNGTVWKDDSQVVEIEAKKNYGANPETIVVIETV